MLQVNYCGLDRLLEAAMALPPGGTTCALIAGYVEAATDYSELANRYNATHDITYRLYVLYGDGSIVGLVACAERVECGDCSIVDERDATVVRTPYGVLTLRGSELIPGEGYMERLVSTLPTAPWEIYFHPAVLAHFVRRFVFVPTRSVLEELAPENPVEWRGVFDPDRLVAAVNPAIYDILAFEAKYTSLLSLQEAAVDYIHTAIHEADHYIRYINTGSIEGTWHANLFAVLLGVPSPGGSELEAEKTVEAVISMVESDNAAMRAVVENMRRRADNLDIGNNREVIAELDDLNRQPGVIINPRPIGAREEPSEEYETVYILSYEARVDPEVLRLRAPRAGSGTVAEVFTRLLSVQNELAEKTYHYLRQLVATRGYRYLRVGMVEAGVFGLSREPVVEAPLVLPEYETLTFEE